MGFKIGNFPFRYLVIPITPHLLHVVHYSPLLDKIGRHINAWNKRNLSFAARRELIGAVLKGIEGFWLFILPLLAGGVG